MSTALATKKKLWDKLDNESVSNYDLFLAFFGLGASRTVSALAEKLGLNYSNLHVLCGQFKWIKRAKAYDNYLRKIQLTALEKQVKSEAAVWVSRESEYRHEAYQFARDLIIKAKEMMASPLYTKEVEEVQDIVVGDQIVQVAVKTVYRPVRWTFKDMNSMADLGDKLMRLSLGVPTSHTKQDVNLSLSISERVTGAKAAMALWIARDLDDIVQRIINDDPSQDPEALRTELIAQAPIWFAKDHIIPDPSMLIDDEDDSEEALEGIQPLSLDMGETDAVN